MLILWAIACDGGEFADDPGAPTVEFLAPEEGDVVAVGAVDVSLVVENFVLEDPAKHGGEGEQAGWIEVTLDGVATLTTAETNFSVDLPAGDVLLGAELVHEDGDPLDPPAFASVAITVE